MFNFLILCQTVAGQVLQGPNICETVSGARSFATKHSFSTDKGMWYGAKFLSYKIMFTLGILICINMYLFLSK